jgi:sec-independent protein translocase protein TatC
MCAMAVPMCVLFEGAVAIAIIHDRRKASRLASQLIEELSSDLDRSELDTTSSNPAR